MSDNHHPNERGSVWKGIGWVAVCMLALFVITMVTGTVALWIGIGMVQLIYVLPLTVVFHRESSTTAGIWIAFGITFLLNSACFGFVFFNFIG